MVKLQFQRCLQSTTVKKCGLFLRGTIIPETIAEKSCGCRTIIQRGLRTFEQQQHTSLLHKNHSVNNMRSCSGQIPVSYVHQLHPLPQKQTRRGLKISALSLISKRRQGQKITMITAYDFPSAIHVARANIDIVLVGDSVAMVELGHVTTQPITMNDMIHHCSAVERGVSFANVPNPPLLVGDMPFGSYEFDDTDIALQNAYRFVKEAGMDAVKLEVRLSCT